VLATAATSLWALKPLIPRWLNVLVATLVIAYLPNLSPYVGYGAAWSWHIIAGLLAAGVLARAEKPAWWFAFPGAVSALGVLGNPPTITALPVIGIALFVAARRAQHDPLKVAAWYVAGAAVVGGAFVLALMVLSDGQALSGLRNVSSADDHDFSLPAQFTRLAEGAWTLLLPVLVGAVAGLAGTRLGGEPQGRLMAPIALLGALLTAVVLVGSSTVKLWFAPQAIVWICGVALLVAQAFARRPFSAPQFILIAAAVGPALGWFWGSNGGVNTAVLAAPLLMVAAVCGLEWPEALTAEALGDARMWTAGLVAVVVAYTGVLGLLNTPEGKTFAMTTPIERGPFKGVKALPAEVTIHRDLWRGMNGLIPVPGRTVYFERFPLGYLYDGVRAGTYSTWATSAVTDRLQAYIDATGNLPQRLVLTRFGANLEDGRFPDTVNLDNVASYAPVYEDINYRVYELQQ